MKMNNNNPKEVIDKNNLELAQWMRERELEAYLNKHAAKTFEQVQFRNKRFAKKFALQADVYKQFQFCNKYYTNDKVTHKDFLRQFMANNVQ
jgi:hypothetical protein